MDKTMTETVVAVVFGIFLGIVAASAFWLIKSQKLNFNPLPKAKVTITPSPTITAKTFGLEVKAPEDQSVVSTENIDLQGTTDSNITVIVSQNAVDTAFKSDSKGNFTKKITLEEGLNVLTITALSSDGQTKQTQIKLVYEIKE